MLKSKYNKSINLLIIYNNTKIMSLIMEINDDFIFKIQIKR